MIRPNDRHIDEGISKGVSWQLDDLRIGKVREVSPPIEVRGEFPVTEGAARTVLCARYAIREILHGRDDRLLVIIGPCSIHDTEAAREYAALLMKVRTDLSKNLFIVMRVYFEKPRTTVGWKGLINDPDLDGSFNINKGLRLARGLLVDINGLGVPTGTEFLDLVSPQYITDLVSWGAIGARTTESQVHRELASGLSCPVGFKNGTDGNLRIAIDAIRSASQPHHFLGVTKAGHSAIFSTTGNDGCHPILRGGTEPNYGAASVAQAAREMEVAGLAARIMIDFSHANSQKCTERQCNVGHDVAGQIAAGEQRIFGVMVESHLKSGRQDLQSGKALVYGKSITDACIGWAKSVELLYELAEAARRRAASILGSSRNRLGNNRA